jgi:hypothetical protein
MLIRILEGCKPFGNARVEKGKIFPKEKMSPIGLDSFASS